MTQFAKETLPISLEEEMRRSYLDYAMSVIVGPRAAGRARRPEAGAPARAVRDARARTTTGTGRTRSRARIVGDVIGKYHPHGDQSVYDTMVRMAQDFSLRYMLVDGQGNFGSVDGDNAGGDALHRDAAWRKIAHELLADIDKETVDFGPELRRQGARAAGAAVAAAEPAGQRLVRHRGRHGDQHPAAQPERGRRRLPARCCDNPEADDRRADGDHPGARLPDRRHHLRPRRRARGLPHRPRPRRDARQARTSRTSTRASARRSSSTRCRTR